MPHIKNYLSLVKFSHTIFAMPFALVGFFCGLLKSGIPINFHDPHWLTVFSLVIVCMVTARNSAMAFNRYLDRAFDALNPRTAIREIPKGIIAPGAALRFVILNCIAFATATYFINFLCFCLSPVALFVILFYSYTKRFTPLCHLVLGIGLSLAPIGAYLAVTGAFAPLPILFSSAVVFWVSGFDIIYALQDVEFDQSQHLYSIPAALGKGRALTVSTILHALSAALVIIAYFVGHFNILYLLATAVFTGMLAYQHKLVKPNDLSRVNIAFMTSNGIASVVFGALVIADMLLFAPITK